MNEDRDDHPRPKLPDVYVPRRHVALKEAVIRLADSRKPHLPIRLYLAAPQVLLGDPLRTVPRGEDPYAWPFAGDGWAATDISMQDRGLCFIALQNARRDFREALAEAELVAKGQKLDGDLEPVSSAYWRTDDGGFRLRFTDRVDSFTQVFILDETFLQWLGAHVQADPALAVERKTTASAEVQTRAWLTRVLTEEDAVLTPKPTYAQQAQGLFDVSGAGFNRVWDEVINSDPDLFKFKKAGPKPRRKSSST